MYLTVLVDNNTLIDAYFLAEPGVSYYIEEKGLKILFDVGYSDVFYKNASQLGINLTNLNYLILSHGHLDHTWGLNHLIDNFSKIYGNNSFSKPTLLAHPDLFFPKKSGNNNIGCTLSPHVLKQFFNLKLSAEPVWLTDKLVFLGEIERKNSFEAKQPIGKVIKNITEQDDYILDDSALAYKSEKGLVIVTGCSHSGICNITEYAKNICNETKIIDIIGGFHLLNPNKQQMDGTINYFTKLNIQQIHPCHCTDLYSKIMLSHCSTLKEVGVGLKLHYI